MQLKLQAWIVGIAFLASQIMNLIGSIIIGEFILTTIFSLLVSVLFIALTMYDTQCLITGGCTVWSWIRTYLYLLIALFMIIGVIYLIIIKKKYEKLQKQQQRHITTYDEEQ